MNQPDRLLSETIGTLTKTEPVDRWFTPIDEAVWRTDLTSTEWMMVFLLGLALFAVFLFYQHSLDRRKLKRRTVIREEIILDRPILACDGALGVFSFRFTNLYPSLITE